MNGIERTLGRIEATLEGIQDEIRMNRELNDSLTVRVGRLERYKAWVMGVTAAIIAITTYMFRDAL